MRLPSLIMVPLVTVLYAIALTSFSVAGYYGFRLTTTARKMKVMVMITQDGPQSIVGGIVLLAVSQIINTIATVEQLAASDFFAVSSVVLLMGSALMFAFGFQKMYSIYLNEKSKMNVKSLLGDLLEAESLESLK